MDLPIRPMDKNSSMKSGSAVSSSPNSSMITSSCGSSGRSGRLSQHVVVGDTGYVAGVLEHLLAALDLTGQAAVGSTDQRHVVRQVGDHPGHVRDGRERGEAGPALVVHQDHRQLFRWVGEEQPEHQGPEQLTLAGTGRTDAQPVRTHSEQGRLLQVEQHRPAGLVDTDRHPHRVPFAASAPQPIEIEVPRIAELEQVDGVGAEGVLTVLGGLRGEPQRRERTGDSLGQADGSVVHRALLAPGSVPAAVLDAELAVGPDRDADRDLLRLLQPVVDEVDHGETEVGGGGGPVRQGQRHGLVARGVDDDQQPGVGRGMRTGEQIPTGGGGGGRATGQVAGQQVRHGGQVGRDATHGAGRITLLVVDQVRQPAGPVPVGAATVHSADGDPDVIGSVQRRDLHQQRPSGSQTELPGTDDAHVSRGVERGAQRHPGDPAEAADQGAGLGQHEGVARLQGVALVLDRQRPTGDRPRSQPDLQKVRVCPATLPQPGRVADDVEQRCRRGVERARLFPEGTLSAAELFALLLQIVEITGPVLAPLTGRPAALADDQDDRGQDGHHHGQRSYTGERRVAEEHHQRHGRGGPGQGEQGLGPGRHRLTLRLHRGGFQLEAARIGERLGDPGRSVHESRAHGVPAVRSSRWRARPSTRPARSVAASNVGSASRVRSTRAPAARWRS